VYEIHKKMEKNFIMNFVGATAPRLPCVSPYCKHCDSHNLQKETVETHIKMPENKPVLSWIDDLPSGVLPHIAYSVTPPRIY
jgi:hypothetical protein